jgi:hypothetical protein
MQVSRERQKKVRAGVYLPQHLAEIAEKTMGSKSLFITEACRFFINNGGLEEWARGKMDEADRVEKPV